MRFALNGAAIAALLALPALAKPPSEWVICDGLAKPEPLSTSIGRLIAVSSTFGIFGAPERGSPELRGFGAQAAAACTTALDSGMLTDDMWARHINLLRARAIHNLEDGKPDATLADVAAIDALAGPRASDVYYERSYGVSSELLTALAQRLRGDPAAAMAAAGRAAALRPWSIGVQTLALDTLTLDQAPDANALALVDRLVILDPTYQVRRAELRARAGDWQGALADWQAALPPVRSSDGALQMRSLLYTDRWIRALGRMANAAAILHQPERAHDLLQQMEARILAVEAGRIKSMASPLPTKLPESRLPAMSPPAATADSVSGASTLEAAGFKALPPPDPQLRAELATASALVQARLALTAGKPADAATALAVAPLLRNTPETVALLDDVGHALTAPQLLTPPGSVIARWRGEFDAHRAEAKAASPRINATALFNALPQPESAATLNDFSSQWGWGLKSTGFKTSTAKPPATFTTIEFVGDTTSRGAVEEMTLLRAADLAAAAGKPGLIIVARRDFQRFTQMTYGGTPIGERQPAGFMTAIDVEFVDVAALPPALADAAGRVIDAAAVQAALRPLYVPAKPAR